MTWQQMMERICSAYRQIMGEALVGIYVHGSIAFGCFHPEKSDIDFLAVTSEPPTPEQKRRMISLLLDLATHAPEKGIEMSVVLERDCRAFCHPTPYQLHYSAAHHAAYLADMDGTLARLQGVDPDLAAHFTVTRQVGIALVGPVPQDLFAPVPRADYLDSIRADVENAAEDVMENPVYILLNLCRVLAYLRDGEVLSKQQGGMWGLAHLPQKYHPLLEKALDAYCGDGKFVHNADQLRAFAREALGEIL